MSLYVSLGVLLFDDVFEDVLCVVLLLTQVY